MKKLTIPALIALTALSCNFLFPQIETPHPTPPPPILVPEIVIPAQISDFVIVRIVPPDGDLMELLSVEAEKAKALNLAPFIEFDATWCPPCQAINASLEAKDESTLNAFAGIYLIRADVDEWGWGDGKNFRFDSIPVWYELDSQGKPTGAQVDGGAWKADIPANFGPVLDSFFHGE